MTSLSDLNSSKPPQALDQQIEPRITEQPRICVEFCNQIGVLFVSFVVF